MLIAVRSVGWISSDLALPSFSITPVCHPGSALRNPLTERNDDFVSASC